MILAANSKAGQTSPDFLDSTHVFFRCLVSHRVKAVRRL